MLTGDLADFSLREILQFLATTSSSGVLELRSVESTAGIALRDGGVCVALLDVNGVRGLAARMIRAGAVDLERLRHVGGQRRIDAIGWAAALGHDVRDADVAADVYLEHTYEALGWLTRVEQATFSFERSAQLDDWPFAAAAVNTVFAVVDERAEQWSELPDTVSDLTLVCSPRPDPADSAEIILTTEQWRVISLVDGRRAVRDLIELSGIGYLETCLLLHELVTAGLVELVAPGASTSLATLLDGLDVERTASPARTFGPPRARTSNAAGIALGLDTAVDMGTPTAGADAEDDSPRTVERAGEPHERAHELDAAPVDEDPQQAAPVTVAAMDESSSDANRTLLERLIGGKGAVR